MKLYALTATVSDPQASPVMVGGGSLFGAGGNWISAVAAGAGPWTVSGSASDRAGVCALRAFIAPAGGDASQAVLDTSADNAANYDQLLPCGPAGARSLGWSPDLTPLANGSYVVDVQGSNPGGGVADAQSVFMLDDVPPLAVTGLTASAAGAGPLGWSASRAFTLAWSQPADATGPQSPVSTASVQVCAADGSACGTAVDQPASSTTAGVSIPVGSAAGMYEAEVGQIDQAGNVGPLQQVALRFDPSAPSAPVLGPARPAVIGQAQLSVPETISATAGLSGVDGYQVTVDTPPAGDVSAVNSSGSYDIANLTSGTHVLYARAFSGAGVPGPVTQVTLNVDRTAP